MFDVGFSELVMVGLVSLLVIGPERLPKVARVAGYWLGKTRRMVSLVKAEITQELHEEEIRQALKHQSGMNEFQNLMKETTDAAQAVKADIDSLTHKAVDLTKPHEPK